MENFPENDKFNKLLAIKTATRKKYSKYIIKQGGDIDKEIEITEKSFYEFDLEYKINLFQMEIFMANDSFSKTTEKDSSDVRPCTSVTAVVKLPTINIKSLDGKPENWHTFTDSIECAIDKNDAFLTFRK